MHATGFYKQNKEISTIVPKSFKDTPNSEMLEIFVESLL